MKSMKELKMKEMKKKRADKISSSNINIYAMLLTIIFCFVVILQGKLSSFLPLGAYFSSIELKNLI